MIKIQNENIWDVIFSLNSKMVKNFSKTFNTKKIEKIENMFFKMFPINYNDYKTNLININNDDKSILTNAIKTVAHKNIKKISDWQKIYPEFNDPASKQNDKYLKIICESMSGGSKEETDKNYNKIVKNIVKETIIDKEPI